METTLAQLRTASIFGAFTTPPKITIIRTLLPGPLHVAAITEATGMPQPIVSQTLTHLRHTGLVTFEQQSTRRYYQLQQPEQVRELLSLAETLAA